MKEYDNAQGMPQITIRGRENCIRIGKAVILQLGRPSHISIMVTDSLDTVVVFPCDEDNVMSFKVPQKIYTDHHCNFRIHSKQFVHGIMGVNQMDTNRTYTVSGKYSENDNSMLFHLTDKVEHISVAGERGA